MVTLLAIFLLAMATALGVFFLWTRSNAHTRLDEEAIKARMHDVDVEAFRNLLDPEEEQYLRENLPSSDFRAVQRERLVAALDYIGALSDNAALLLQLGQTARHSPDPRVVDAARHVVDNALRLRLYALQARCGVYAKIAFPGASLEPRNVVTRYHEVNNWASVLSRLQRPSGGAVAKAV